MGLQTIYYRDFPYFILPPNHSQLPGLPLIAIVFGVIFTLVGLCIAFAIKARPVSLLFGSLLLLIFCLYNVPFQFSSDAYKHFPEWENAAKELALAGVFVIAGCYSAINESSFTRYLGKLIPLGTIVFAVPVVCFGILHFMLAQESTVLVPAWIPAHLFWIYFAGVALLGSGIAILLKIKSGL